MSPGTASPAVALAAFGSPVAKTPSAIAAATTGSDLEASPGSAAASGPPAAPPHAPATLANDSPAAVRGGGDLLMPIVVAPPQSMTPDDAPVSGEPVSEKEVPPTAVATASDFTDTAVLAEAPAPFGSPVASAEPTTAVANGGADQGVITATTCASSGIATPRCTATTAAMPPAAVYGNDRAELAVPETTMPEKPSASLHSLALAGPDHSAMPVSSAGDAQARPSDLLLLEIQTCVKLSHASLVSGFHVCKAGLAHCVIAQRPEPSVMTAISDDAVQYMPATVAYDIPMMLIISQNDYHFSVSRAACQQSWVLLTTTCHSHKYMIFNLRLVDYMQAHLHMPRHLIVVLLCAQSRSCLGMSPSQVSALRPLAMPREWTRGITRLRPQGNGCLMKVQAAATVPSWYGLFHLEVSLH
jgi:hypothetical protein